jgi:hypothetical protein
MAWKIDRTRGPWQTEGLSERSDGRGGRRPLMIEIEPRLVRYRPKGTRQSFVLTHEKIYQLAVQAHVEASRPTRRRTVKRGRQL